MARMASRTRSCPGTSARARASAASTTASARSASSRAMSATASPGGRARSGRARRCAAGPPGRPAGGRPTCRLGDRRRRGRVGADRAQQVGAQRGRAARERPPSSGASASGWTPTCWLSATEAPRTRATRRTRPASASTWRKAARGGRTPGARSRPSRGRGRRWRGPRRPAGVMTGASDRPTSGRPAGRTGPWMLDGHRAGRVRAKPATAGSRPASAASTARGRHPVHGTGC